MGIDEARTLDDAKLVELRGRAAAAVVEGIAITDPHRPDNPIIDVNPAFERLTGYTAAEILGRNCRFLQGPGTDPDARCQLREAVAAGRDCQVEILNYRKDGTPFWNELHLSPVRDPTGRITHYIGIQHDITARRAAEERLAALAVENARLLREAQQAVRDRDRFLSIAAHELRTPVAGIKGYAQMLVRAKERGTLSPDRLVKGLASIDRSTAHLTALTNDLLDVARLRLGQLPLRPVRLALGPLVGEVVDRVVDGRSLVTRPEIAVETGLPLVRADPERIGQVLANLIDNAATYSPEGGVIRVALRAEGGGVAVEVADEGIGLPRGAEEVIFEPFGRAENALQRSLPGLGLGLNICRSIVERHGGRIWARSAGEDRGSTVGFWLPAAEA